MTSPASVRPAREPPVLPLGSLGQRDKLRSWHRERLAAVYIRQSTAQQVLVHAESTRLQYGLVRHAEAYGWASDRILVIDEDLGKSGTSAAGRTGFERLVTEVSLGHVGLCRPDPGPGDVAFGAFHCRLAPPARSLRALRHAHC